MEELHLLDCSLPSVREKKENKVKEKKDWVKIHQAKERQLGTDLFSLIIRHPAEGERQCQSLLLRLSFNLQLFNGKHFLPFLNFTQREKVGDGPWKPSCDREIPPQTSLCMWAERTWSRARAIASPPGEPSSSFPERKAMATSFPEGLQGLAPVCVAFGPMCVYLGWS